MKKQFVFPQYKIERMPKSHSFCPNVCYVFKILLHWHTAVSLFRNYFKVHEHFLLTQEKSQSFAPLCFTCGEASALATKLTIWRSSKFNLALEKVITIKKHDYCVL